MPVIRFPQTRGSILRNFHPTLVYPSGSTVPTPQTGAHQKDAL